MRTKNLVIGSEKKIKRDKKSNQLICVHKMILMNKRNLRFVQS